MDSSKILSKCLNLVNKLKSGDSEVNLILDELFENLILLINIYKVKFDLESFIRVANEQSNLLTFEIVKEAAKDKNDSGLNNKKNVKRLLNIVVLYLLDLLRDEKHFDQSLDRLVDFLEYEYESSFAHEHSNKPVKISKFSSNSLPNTPKNIRKSTEFMHLFLLSLFYGDYYHLGIVQHYLLNSRHSLNLPECLSNVIKHMERTVVFKRLLNKMPSKGDIVERGDTEMINSDCSYELGDDSEKKFHERFDERFLIFVTKLNTPDVYRKNQDKGELLKIPRKELGVRNPVTPMSTSYADTTDEIGDKDDSMSGFEKGNKANRGYHDDSDYNDDEDGDATSDDFSNMSNDTVEEEDYGNDYIKLWQAILDQMLYRVSSRNLVIILESLPTKVFPYIYSPLKVANFLHILSRAECASSTNSTITGNDGETAPNFSGESGNKLEGDADVVINSLNCLFELILYYNLTDQIVASFTADSTISNGIHAPYELDWFYKRLDRLIDIDYLSSLSSVVLLSLIERALNSSMLPNKLVSYFIKRLLATSTVVETRCCNALLVIALRLLQKHHHQLVHQISTHGTATSSYDGGVSSDDTKDSLFLHELYLLLHHFNNDTVKIVGVYFTQLKNKITFSLGDFVGAQNATKNIEKSKNTHYNPFRANIQNTTTISRSFFR
ncbi:hypothetical protein MACJ_002583 [Theileria orientalis]|uniref:CCAAT-binding factor domain-containing protein n=1 Tax=Theileria orientalis TaxID=68886 RepID=A0A976M6D6_THEOR|nr:hypothetical protein MACJ_002583 [Theileria orientalis]